MNPARWPPWLLGLLPIAAIGLGWALAAAAGLVPPALLPPPLAVAARVAGSAVDPVFLGEALVTLRRLAAGFALALGAGTTLALLAASSRSVDAALRPLLRLLAPVPKIALYPALLLSLGFGDAAKIALVAADAVFPIFTATYRGAVSVEPKLVWSARALGMSRGAAALRVVLPACLPAILTGSRVGLVVGCIVVFLAEMIASTDGLGFLLVRAGRNFQTADMFVPLVAISAIGLAADLGLSLLQRRLLVGWGDHLAEPPP